MIVTKNEGNLNENKNKNRVWEFQGMNKLPKKVRKTFISLLTKLQNLCFPCKNHSQKKDEQRQRKGNEWMKRSHGLPAKKEEALSACLWVCILNCVQRNPIMVANKPWVSLFLFPIKITIMTICSKEMILYQTLLQLWF